VFPHGDEIPWWTWSQNLFHSDGYRLDSHSVKKYVAPDPSRPDDRRDRQVRQLGTVDMG